MPVLHAMPRRDQPWRVPFPTHTLIAVVGKGLEIPEGGWTAAEFARQGTLLLRVMHRLAQLTQRRAIPHVAKTAKKVMRRQMKKVVEKVLSRRSAKDTLLEVLAPDMSGLWHQALEEVFRETGVEAAMELMPPVQSVMGRGYSVTNELLAQEGEVAANQRLAREARDIAQRIVGISDTTREQFGREIQRAIDEGLTVTETADRLVERFPDMAQSRINTIARTELNNAYAKGSVASMQESGVVTHVSVIGCQAREPGSPQYRGESTCNIQDVPIADADKLEFHPNHTGSIVPSGFIDAQGPTEL